MAHQIRLLTGNPDAFTSSRPWFFPVNGRVITDPGTSGKMRRFHACQNRNEFSSTSERWRRFQSAILHNIRTMEEVPITDPSQHLNLGGRRRSQPAPTHDFQQVDRMENHHDAWMEHHGTQRRRGEHGPQLHLSRRKGSEDAESRDAKRVRTAESYTRGSDIRQAKRFGKWEYQTARVSLFYLFCQIF